MALRLRDHHLDCRLVGSANGSARGHGTCLRTLSVLFSAFSFSPFCLAILSCVDLMCRLVYLPCTDREYHAARNLVQGHVSSVPQSSPLPSLHIEGRRFRGPCRCCILFLSPEFVDSPLCVMRGSNVPPVAKPPKIRH